MNVWISSSPAVARVYVQAGRCQVALSKLVWYRMAVVLCPLQWLFKILGTVIHPRRVFNSYCTVTRKSLGLRSVVKRAWPRPSEVCILLFLQMFSWAPTLIQVRGVTGKWDCISSVSPSPCTVDFKSRYAPPAQCLSCLIPQPEMQLLPVFAGSRKRAASKYLGSWSLYFWDLTFAWNETVILPSLRKCRLLLQKDLWRVFQLKIISHQATQTKPPFFSSQNKNLYPHDSFNNNKKEHFTFSSKIDNNKKPKIFHLYLLSFLGSLY